MNKLAVLSVLLLSLVACAPETKVQTKYVEKTSAVCGVLKRPVNSHMNAVVDNGEAILAAGADRVLVTATELSDVYDASCK